MGQVSSYDENPHTGDILELYQSDFSYVPAVGDWVGLINGRFSKKNSSLASNDSDVLGVVTKVREKITILNNGIWLTDIYNTFTDGDTLFLASVSGTIVKEIENTTNFVKKVASKIPGGIIVDIEPADKYQFL